MARKELDQYKSLIRMVEALIEVTTLSFVYFYLFLHVYDPSLFPTVSGNGKYVLMLVYGATLSAIFLLNDSFKYGRLKLSHISISQAIALTLTDIITYVQLCLIANRIIAIGPMFLLIVIDILLGFIFSYLYTAIYHMIYVPSNILMVAGSDQFNVSDLKFKVDSRADKYTITKVMKAEEGLEAIYAESRNHDALIIYDVPSGIKEQLLKYCYRESIRTYVVPTISDIIVRGATDVTLFDTPLLLVRGYGFNALQKAVKRSMDVVLSLLGLLLGIPFMIVIAIAIKLEDGGPVLFKQDRVTRDEKVFAILKFRSMIVDADKDGDYHPATDEDERITRVGRIIRPLRLDELPQLFNILKGDMSIVGPRPERVEHVRKYSQELPEFSFRHKVKAGLTGYAQIYGKYNTSAYDKLCMDLEYIENYTVLLDIKLIIETVRILFKKDSTEGFK